MNHEHHGGVIAVLMGRQLATAAALVSLFTISWLVSLFLNYLNYLQPFPDEIFRLVKRLEIYMIYFDAAVCVVVLLASARRSLTNILRLSP